MHGAAVKIKSLICMRQSDMTCYNERS